MARARAWQVLREAPGAGIIRAVQDLLDFERWSFA